MPVPRDQSDNLVFRAAVPSDYDAMAAIATLAYPWGGESAESLAERYRATHPATSQARTRARAKTTEPELEAPRGGRERWVVERDRTLVASYTDLALEFWVGGRAGGARGLSGVTVAPEARKTGIARAILEHHATRARDGGATWSLCYAYAPDFYAKFGWAGVGRKVRWRGSPDELPLFTERALVRRLDLTTTLAFERISESYAQHCATTNGSVARPGFWRRPTGASDFVVAVGDDTGPLRGYAVASYRATRARQTLVVSELVAHDGEARRALVGFFAAQRDQADAIEIDTPEGDAIGSVFARRASARVEEDDPEDHRPAATVYDGLLARAVDLASAFAQRGYGKSARLRITVHAEDGLLRDNAAPFVVTIDRGRARPARSAARGGREPTLRGSIDALTRVVTGAMRLRDAIAYDLVHAERASGRLLEALDAALALPPPAPLLVF